MKYYIQDQSIKIKTSTYKNYKNELVFLIHYEINDKDYILDFLKQKDFNVDFIDKQLKHFTDLVKIRIKEVNNKNDVKNFEQYLQKITI